MNEALETFWQWAVPALIVFGGTAILSTAAIWALRRARRSPRARAAVEPERIAAGSALVRLDDAVAELEIEVGLSGALYDGTAPPALRRARMLAQHARDESFAEFREIDDDTHPDDVRRASRRIQARTEAAAAAIAHARTEHADWTRANVAAAVQVQAARQRWGALRDQIGDPQRLLDDLTTRFDPTEWADAARAAAEARGGLEEADLLLTDAAERAADPARSALSVLTRAERTLRRTEAAARTLEENHRLVTEAANAVLREIEEARVALRQGSTVRDGLEPADAARLGDELRQIEAELTAEEADALRRPTHTVAAVARLRDRLDLALGDARTAQQRLRGARTALPGAFAAARSAIAHAAPSVVNAGADARVRLAAAERELALARDSGDPVAALDAARRALRDAEDASALADYEHLTRG